MGAKPVVAKQFPAWIFCLAKCRLEVRLRQPTGGWSAVLGQGTGQILSENTPCGAMKFDGEVGREHFKDLIHSRPHIKVRHFVILIADLDVANPVAPNQPGIQRERSKAIPTPRLLQVAMGRWIGVYPISIVARQSVQRVGTHRPVTCFAP